MRVPWQNYVGPDKIERWHSSPDTTAETGLSGSGVVNAIVEVWGPVPTPLRIDHLGVMADAAGVGEVGFAIVRVGTSLSDIITDVDNGVDLTPNNTIDLADITPNTLFEFNGLDELSEMERTMQIGDRLVAYAILDGGEWGADGLGFCVLAESVAPVTPPPIGT